MTKIHQKPKSRSRSRSLLGVTLIAAAALALAGCAPGNGDEPQGPATNNPTTPSSQALLSGELTVFAAASLSDVFEELLSEFKTENPEVSVQPAVYDGSQVLATQLREGAPADVFATADEKTMAGMGDLVTDPQLFATNVLQIAVANGNPLNINSLADAARSDVKLVLCIPDAPCGASSQRLFEEAGITPKPVSEEQNVRSVLTKVSLGEADAGLVYASDVAASDGQVTGVAIAGADVNPNRYPIAQLANTKNAEVAQAFIDFVRSDAGAATLSKYGFGKP